MIIQGPDSEIERLFRETNRLLERIHLGQPEWEVRKLMREAKETLDRIGLYFPTPPQIQGFVIEQENTMLTLAPGNSPVFTATPVPATSVPSTPPTWTSSDTVNAPVSADSTGLIGTVAIPPTAVVGSPFILSVSYTNQDGTVATGSFSGSIVAPPSPDITSFTIAQTT
jgi:hypothetical protein